MLMLRTFSRVFFSLTLVAASTSGHALSLASVLRLHPHLVTAASTKAKLTLSNPNSEFRDVMVDNKFYTVLPRHHLLISAPAGTPVFAASGMFRNHRKGAVLAQVDSKDGILALD